MENNAQVLMMAIAAGKSLETGLEQLRKMGVTPVETIKAIREAKHVSLGEAKQIFSASPAWELEVRAADALQNEVLSLGTEESKC